ncbi:Caffeoyl-CoA O-methyltransferase 2 [Triticum urartu]|uniref:Caffeoyl-CoA O-methyltransferase 2 n=1 Tax=Triticum urartu TaxID=4572 RepID=M8A1K1_TRIUA|nr:Caffeoyl-CoA O-methyltransferase 2 [Triticum urartu]
MAPNGDNTVANVHSGIDSTNKTLLKSDALYTYILDTTVFPREHECMRDLRLITDKHPWGYMQSSSDEAQLLGMLIKMAGAKKTIEVGVFTGYSLLATALALPEDGKVVAIDTDRECYEIIRQVNQSPYFVLIHGSISDFMASSHFSESGLIIASS